MKTSRLPVIACFFVLIATAAVTLAQVDVQVEELDIGGSPPGLEGMPAVFLRNQDTGKDHLVIFGGCTEDSLWDQALVLSDVSGGFDDLTWTTVPVPGMGPACEHIVAGPGDVAWLIGGYEAGWSMRPMNEILEIRLSGSETNPVIETTEIEVPCSDCPKARVGHAATWVDEFDDCDGGGVLFAGGMDDEWHLLDDVWLVCPESGGSPSENPHFRKFAEMLMSEPMSDFGLLFDQRRKQLYRIVTIAPLGLDVLDVQRWDREHQKWVTINDDPEEFRPPARTAYSATILPGGQIQVVGGWNAVDGFLDDVWVFYPNVGRAWELRQGSGGPLVDVMNHASAVVPPLLKQGGTAQTILFGGVEDFTPPRVLSDSTFLITLTGLENPPDFAVPAVARVQGAGAFFTSIMHLFNAGASDLELEMVFTPRQGSGGAVTTVDHTLAAGVMETIEDPLEALFGFSGGAGRVGSVMITVNSGSPDDLMLQTVVFARLDTGEEYGQFFPAMTRADAITAGERVYLNTTEDPVHNRVNIGLMALVDGTVFRVTPVDPLGDGLAAPKSYDLDASGNTQINNLQTSFALASVPDVVVEVEVLEGSGLAYASVLDGNGSYAGTSDPTTILPAAGGSREITLLEIGSIQGLNEFSGSASITNYSDHPASVRADFYQRGSAGVTATETLSIAAGDTVGYSDLGSDLFGISGDVGAVVLSSTNGTEIGATGREFAIYRDGGEIVGTAGQLIAGLVESDRLSPGRTYHFIGLRQTSGGGGVERSHFAVFNPAGVDAEVTVRLDDGASGAPEGERSWTIPSKTLIQVNNVIRAINSGHNDGEKRIEVEVDQPVFVRAFRVNPYGDPITISPFSD